jgi:hypothetical protein
MSNLASKRLPSPNRGVHMLGIRLKTRARPSSALGGDHRGAASLGRGLPIATLNKLPAQTDAIPSAKDLSGLYTDRMAEDAVPSELLSTQFPC